MMNSRLPFFVLALLGGLVVASGSAAALLDPAEVVCYVIDQTRWSTHDDGPVDFDSYPWFLAKALLDDAGAAATEGVHDAWEAGEQAHGGPLPSTGVGDQLWVVPLPDGSGRICINFLSICGPAFLLMGNL